MLQFIMLNPDSVTSVWDGAAEVPSQDGRPFVEISEAVFQALKTDLTAYAKIKNPGHQHFVARWL